MECCGCARDDLCYSVVLFLLSEYIPLHYRHPKFINLAKLNLCCNIAVMSLFFASFVHFVSVFLFIDAVFLVSF